MTDAGRKGFNASAAPFIPGASAAGPPLPGDVSGDGSYGSVFGQQHSFLQMAGGAGGGPMGGGGYGPMGASGAGGFGMMQPPTPMQVPPHLLGASLEVYDAEVKAQIPIPVQFIFHTAGAYVGLQQQMQQGRQASAAAANRAKVCTAFVMHGGCRMGDGCREIHPVPEALEEARARVYQWMAAKEEQFLMHPDASYKVFYSDLKEVISVPASALTFTRGLFLDPADREKRPAVGNQGHGHRGNPTIAQQAPTACGLYASNPASCKWGKYCNQAHVAAEWIDNHRRQFEQWSSSLEAQFRALPEDATFVVHDPMRRVLLRVPKHHIAAFTRGLLQSTTDKCPSVCLLSLQARCTAGPRCNQAHIDPHWLADHAESGDAVIDPSGLGSRGTSVDFAPSDADNLSSRQASAQFAPPPVAAFAVYPPAPLATAGPEPPQPFGVGSPPRGMPSQPSQPVHSRQPAPLLPQQQQQQQHYPGLAPRPVESAFAVDAPPSGVRPPGPLPPTATAAPGKFSRNAVASPTFAGVLAPSTPPSEGGVPPHMVSPIRPPQNGPGGGAGGAFGSTWGTYGFSNFKTPDSAGQHAPTAQAAHNAFGAPGSGAVSTPNHEQPVTPSMGGFRGLSFSFPLASHGLGGTVSPLMRSTTNPPQQMKVSFGAFDEVLGATGAAYLTDTLGSLPPPAAPSSALNTPGLHPAPLQPPPTPPQRAVASTSQPSTPLNAAKSPLMRQAPRNPRYSPGGRPVAALGAPQATGE